MQVYHAARPARRVAGLEIWRIRPDLCSMGGERGGWEGGGGVAGLVVTGGTDGVTGRYAYRGVSVQPAWPGSDSEVPARPGSDWGVNKLY